MIIELFGPPGSGKTTFAHALAKQLRNSGYRAEVVLSHRQVGKKRLFDSFGVSLFFYRVFSALLSALGTLLTSTGRNIYLPQSTSLIKAVRPQKLIWRVRLWQYIMNLAKFWDRSSKSSDIVIFDQGYIQAVGSLAIFNGSADQVALRRGISLAPAADFAIRVVMPPAVVESRLLRRREAEMPAERLFEADVKINMRSIQIFDEISQILRSISRRFISIDTCNEQSLVREVIRVESEIVNLLQARSRLTIAEMPDAEAAASASIDRNACDIGGDPAVTMPDRNLVLANNNRSHNDVQTRLALGSAFALAIYIGGAGVTSVAQFGIARLIGTTSYGIYSYALAWTSVLAYLATLGFNVSLLRFVASYTATGQLDLARGVIDFAIRRALAAAILAAAAMSVLIFFFSEPWSELQISLLLGMATVPLITSYALGATIVRSFGGVVSALLPERVARDGALLVFVGFAAFSGHWTVDAPLVMAAVLASSAITTALVVVIALRLRPPGLRQAVTSKIASPQWWSVVPPIMLMTGLDVFISRTGIMVLGWAGHIREAGIFALGLNVALLVGLSRIAVSTMFSPTAAGLYARNDRTGLQALFARASLLCVAGALAMAIPLLFIAEPLLRWFGEDFVSGAPIARILIVGYLVASAFGPQVNLLTMTGNEWAAAATMVGGAIVSVVSCAAGNMMFGLIGAAAGISLALVIWNVAMAIYINQRLGIMPGLIFAIRTARVQVFSRRLEAGGRPAA